MGDESVWVQLTSLVSFSSRSGWLSPSSGRSSTATMISPSFTLYTTPLASAVPAAAAALLALMSTTSCAENLCGGRGEEIVPPP